MTLERILLYSHNFPEVLEHLAANCKLFDEEKIEWMNALVTRTIHPKSILFITRAVTNYPTADRSLVQSTNYGPWDRSLQIFDFDNEGGLGCAACP